MMKTIIYVLILSFSGLFAQINNPGSYEEYLRRKGQRLSGPRTGITVVTGKVADNLREELDASPIITQFGWQFERQVNSSNGELALLSEFVPLVGGLEQGLFLPSLSWIFGVRGQQGREFGVGANLSVAGGAYVIAAGVTKRVGNINIPINGSLVLSKGGPRFSILIGLNMLD